MADLGKILYEMHCANVLELYPGHADQITAWDDCEDQVRTAWTNTAAEFLQHFDEGKDNG